MHSMSSSELHLFVFEGARAESKYVDKLEQHFLGQRDAKHHFRETVEETHQPQMSGSGCIKRVSCLRFGLLRG